MKKLSERIKSLFTCKCIEEDCSMIDSSTCSPVIDTVEEDTKVQTYPEEDCITSNIKTVDIKPCEEPLSDFYSSTEMGINDLQDIKISEITTETTISAASTKPKRKYTKRVNRTKQKVNKTK